MATEQKVTSLKLSKELKKAGAKQESEWSWRQDMRTGDISLINYEDDGPPYRQIASAFDCAELLEMLPCTAEQPVCLTKLPGGFIAALGHENLGSEPTNKMFLANAPAEALGKLELWRLENGHCEKGGQDEADKV